MMPTQTTPQTTWRAADILKRLLGLVRPALREPVPERTEAAQVAFERRVAKRRARNKVARKSRRVNRLAAQR
jgi:hypothetical protein